MTPNIKSLLHELHTDPSTGLAKLRFEIKPYANAEETSQGIGDLAHHNSPVPMQFAVTVLRTLRTLIDYLEEVASESR